MLERRVSCSQHVSLSIFLANMGQDHIADRLTLIARDVLVDARVACCAMRNYRPPPTANSSLDLAIEAVTLSACRTLESAMAVFDLGDHDSAGALTRKALEFAYVLVMLSRKRDHGVELLEQWGARNLGSGLQAMMSAQRGQLCALDPEKVKESIREFASAVPNGILDRVSEKQLSEWADLSEVHSSLYSTLNAHAHFDLFEALSLQRQVMTPNDKSVVDDLCLNRALIATKIQEVVLIAIRAIDALGASGMKSILDNQAAKLERLYAEATDIAENRARRDKQFGLGS